MLSRCLSVEVESILLKRFCSFCSRLLEFVIVLVRSKISKSLNVVESVSCLVYSFVNHVVGTRAQPIFLSVFVRIMSLWSLRLWIWVVCDCVMLRCCGLKRFCKFVEFRYCEHNL